MTGEPKFDTLVQKLTREHLVHVHTDEGSKFVTTDGLLTQLRAEVIGSSDSGAVSGNKMRLPFNAPAVDLYQLIDRQVAEVWAAAFNRVPNSDRTERLLAEWAAFVDADMIVTYSTPETITHPDSTFGWPRDEVLWNPHETKAIYLLARWVRSIEDLFDPPRVADIMAACILCGAREVHRPQDGAVVRQAALQFVRDRVSGDSTEARCLSCGASWLPSQFKYLAEKIAENEIRLKKVDA